MMILSSRFRFVIERLDPGKSNSPAFFQVPQYLVLHIGKRDQGK